MVCDVSDIGEDLKKCKKYMVDSTEWDEDEEANLSEPTKCSKKVKFNITASAVSMASAALTSKSMITTLLADTPMKTSIVQQNHQFPPVSQM